MHPSSKKSKKITIPIVGIIELIILVIIVTHENQFANPQEELAKKIIACCILVGIFLLFVAFYDKFITLPVELYQNRNLIWKLAKNDFKTRYAGSFFGIVWAFVQPIVTIAVYWFVFENRLGIRGELMKNGQEAPYVLWLTAGIIPWFYFTEALTNGTTSLMEYSYLVKKVVFKISIIPIIKIIGATFNHGFFVLFMLVLYGLHGFTPDVYSIQIIYYSFCVFIFVLGLSYATCSIVIFFRDLTQIISIILQVGMWATPILWRFDTIDPRFQIIFKLNPVFYAVNGYRNALLEKSWFWEDFFSTMFFWIITGGIFVLGSLVFKRLKVHFADTL